MRTLGLPKRFPSLQTMKNSPISTWITWVRDENNDLIAAIDEEIARRGDPDDPFDGTASGIFPPLQAQTQTASQNRVKVDDESRSRNSHASGIQEGRLIDVPGQTPRQGTVMTQRQEANPSSQTQEQQATQHLDGSRSYRRKPEGNGSSKGTTATTAIDTPTGRRS